MSAALSRSCGSGTTLIRVSTFVEVGHNSSGSHTVLYGRRLGWQVTSFISGIEVRLQSYIRPTCADVSLCVAPMKSAEGSLI